MVLLPLYPRPTILADLHCRRSSWAVGKNDDEDRRGEESRWR
jgi:hypothetical protein